jgi:alpha-L-fucosidase 2
VELDLDWADGRLKQLKVRGKPGQTVKVRYGDRLTEMKLDGKGHARMQG